MYAVIFHATLKEVDAAYFETAKQMRELAQAEYGCTGFTSCTEGDAEIAISYWPSLEHIQVWKIAPEHLAAQAKGRKHWYKNYRVEIVELLRTTN